jgi:hypothetical protein
MRTQFFPRSNETDFIEMYIYLLLFRKLTFSVSCFNQTWIPLFKNNDALFKIILRKTQRPNFRLQVISWGKNIILCICMWRLDCGWFTVAANPHAGRIFSDRYAPFSELLCALFLFLLVSESEYRPKSAPSPFVGPTDRADVHGGGWGGGGGELNKSIFNSAHSLLALFADPSYTVS